MEAAMKVHQTDHIGPFDESIVWFVEAEKPLRRQETLLSHDPVAEKDLWKTVYWAFDLWDNAASADFSVDQNAIIRCANGRAAELLGHTRKDYFGMPVRCLFADTPAGKTKAEILLERCKMGDPVESEELQMRKADGAYVWVALCARSAIHDCNSFKEIRLSAVDISARKKVEDRSAEHLREIFGTLSGGVADELNKLMNINLGYINLSRSLVPQESILVRYLDAMEKSCQFGTALCDKLIKRDTHD